jgi:hypothetical protein
MGPAAWTGVIFLGLGVIFLTAAARDYRRSGRTSSPARRAWMRVAVVFLVIGVALQFVDALSGR